MIRLKPATISIAAKATSIAIEPSDVYAIVADKEPPLDSKSLIKSDIAKASDIGIDKFVVHPSCEPIADELRAEFIKNSQESLNELAEFAHLRGAVIAVENLPRTCLGRDSKEMLELISVNDKLRVCFDTNHVLKENVVDFVKNVKDKIVTLHVSDCDFVNERHWLPGEGKVDWPELTTALKEINYNGVWMYEIGLKTPDSIKRERDLTFVDFVHNAEQLFKQQ